MVLPLWTLLVATLGLIWFLKRRQAKKERFGHLKELPGPKGWPIIGNLLQVHEDQNKQFCKWSEEFGDIYKVKLGNLNIAVVSDPKLSKEIFSSDPVFTGRLILPPLAMYEEHPELGIAPAEGEKWEVHRRFLLRQLRDFGFGKSSMEGLIMQEVHEVLQRFKKNVGKPVGEIRQTLKLAVVNSLWGIICSKRFDQNDEQLLKLANDVSDGFNEAFSSGAILVFMPWVRHFFPKGSGYVNIRKLIEDLKHFLQSAIDDKKKTSESTGLNDFIDVYLAEMKNAENDPASHFHGHVGELQLVAILADMFFAGSDTTATTLGWAVLYLCKFPEAQKKLQQEIKDITGDLRDVSVDDRPNMPYTSALIDEVLRMSSIVPDGLQHRAMADREFHGYLIEKDVLIQPNLHYIHHNPKTWGDPENFRPERFLSPDGKKYMKSENVQAFQIGRRQCVGETLARDSLFLFLTNLFQQFEMKFNPDEPEPSIEGEKGFIRVSKPYRVIMSNRIEK